MSGWAADVLLATMVLMFFMSLLLPKAPDPHTNNRP